MSTEQKRHAVIIDEKAELFDVAEQRLSKTTRESRFDGNQYATSKLVAVLKAYNKCKTKINDLDMIEVEVDGSPFPA